MLYQLRDASSEWLVAASANVVTHAYAGVEPALASRIVVALRVEDYDAELEVRLRALDQAHGEGPRYGGWAVHDEAKLRARASAPRTGR